MPSIPSGRLQRGILRTVSERFHNLILVLAKNKCDCKMAVYCVATHGDRHLTQHLCGTRVLSRLAGIICGINLCINSILVADIFGRQVLGSLNGTLMAFTTASSGVGPLLFGACRDYTVCSDTRTVWSYMLARNISADTWCSWSQSSHIPTALHDHTGVYCWTSLSFICCCTVDGSQVSL